MVRDGYIYGLITCFLLRLFGAIFPSQHQCKNLNRQQKHARNKDAVILQLLLVCADEKLLLSQCVSCLTQRSLSFSSTVPAFASNMHIFGKRSLTLYMIICNTFLCAKDKSFVRQHVNCVIDYGYGSFEPVLVAHDEAPRCGLVVMALSRVPSHSLSTDFF